MFTRDLRSVLIKSASTALLPTQYACLNTHGHDPALIEMHLGSRTSTPILHCLVIFDSVSAVSCSRGAKFRTSVAGTAR